MASNKPMTQWNDSEVKAWINSLTSLNDKQKQLICNGVDSIGCDGDSLACAETPDELKDALEIPIILARKLHKEVCSHNKEDDENKDNEDDSNKNNNNSNTSNTNTNTNTNNSNSNKIFNKSDNSNSNDNSNNKDSGNNNKDGGEQESEEAVLARLIARNLAAKKTQAPQQQQAAPMMGMGMNMGNNMGIGGMQQQQASNNNQGGGGVKSLFTWGSSNNNANSNNMMGQQAADFKINIQGSNGKLISLNQKCNKHTKIKQVKQMLASQEGGDPAKMVMKYNGRTMDDMQNLGFYGIADSRNLITVTFKVVGGN